jgi:hypothetical protein
MYVACLVSAWEECSHPFIKKKKKITANRNLLYHIASSSKFCCYKGKIGKLIFVHI